MKRFLTLAALLSLVYGIVGCNFLNRQERLASTLEGRDYQVDPTKDYRNVKLESVMADPTGYKLVDIIFDAVFHRNENMWVAYYTHFSPEGYHSFSVWPDLYDGKSFAGDLPFLFMAKDNPQSKTLLSLKPYTPVRVYGKVIYDFGDYPWIEVYFVKPMGEPLFTDKALRSLLLGLSASQAQKKDEAVLRLQDALNDGLPARAKETATAELARLNGAPVGGDAQPAPAPTPVTAKAAAEYEEVIEQMHTKVMEQGFAIDQLKNDLETAGQKSALVAKENEELRKAVQELEKGGQESVTTAKAELEAATQREKEAQAKLTETEKKAADTGEQLAAKTKELEESQKSAGELKEKVAKLESQTGDVEKVKNEDLAAKEGQIATLTSNLENLKAEKEKLEAENKGKGGDLEGVKKDLETEKEAFAESEKALAEKSSAFAHSEEELKNAKEELAATREELKKAQELSTHAGADVTAKLDEVTKKNDELLQQIAKLTEEKNSLSGKVDTTEKERIRQYESKIKSLNGEIEALLKEQEAGKE